uniref:Basement membrane-specific heparan sulfate proteoglycan core protein n=1 Tax=Lygus hesperus TaxID=30085 RepID=A0A0A9YRP0_LYGHE
MHRIRTPLVRGENEVSVRIFEGEWEVTNPAERQYNAQARREDIMMALADIRNILIRVQYIEGDGIDTAITDINMDSATSSNTGRAKAAFVEECTCPRGYTGDSCESCARGFIRQPGSYLGVCSEDIEPCPPGTYGDPSRGIGCKPCACPLSGNSITCELGPDNYPICNCPVGYIGRRCEQCDSYNGFSGDARFPPNSPRGCRRSECSEAGSRSIYPQSSGTCDCKRYVTGPRCDQCAKDSFFLSSQNENGCIKCFCMGITKDCRSSDLYRDTIQTSFPGNSAQGFTLVKKTDDQFEKIEPIVDASSRELYFDNFDTEVYYWAVSPAYLFDKVTSYGGNLTYSIRYTPSPGGMSSKNSAADVEIRSENRITLYHFSKQTIEPEQTVTVTVPLLEQHWQGEFGHPTDREQLLQALADISGIYIKATYTTSTSRASLISVSMDTATGLNNGRPKALEVEDCQCPLGYSGTSCEDCSPGYKRTDDGIYLRLCEPCECNGHSDDCDPESGVCRNCRGNRAGDHCENCAPGYFLTPDNRCDRQEGSCDERGTSRSYGGQCRCKTNVEGQSCDTCRPGFFHLSADNDYGCSQCYCSGVTSVCQSSTLFMEEVPAAVLDNNHGFTLSDGSSTVIRDGFRIYPGESGLGYNKMSRRNSRRLFWSLPSRLTGDKVLSYGGTLKFAQRYSTFSVDSEPISDQDVIIIGNGKSIFYTFEEPLDRETLRESSVKISEEKEWRILDQTAGNPLATREDILKVLSNVDHILVRASLASNIDETFIGSVSLETASQNPDMTRADQIEVCRCPSEYRGTSCQNCAENHYRDSDNTCKRCPCEHGRGCTFINYEVRCNCDPGWTGNLCDEQVNPTSDDSVTDEPPSEPLIRLGISVSPEGHIPEGTRVTLTCTADSNSAEPIRIVWSKERGRLPRVIDDNNGRLTIINAHPSDSGVYLCTANTRSASETKSVIVMVDETQSIRPSIRIHPSNTIEVLEGGDIWIQCITTGYPLPDIEWFRIDGRSFNEQAEITGGNIRITSALKSDQGEYECRATNQAGQDTQRVVVNVQAQDTDIGQLSIVPRDINAIARQTITITCQLEPPSYSYTLHWRRNDRRDFPRRATDNNGQLTIRDIELSDAGEYVCEAIRTSSGQIVSESSAYIRVRRGPSNRLTAAVNPERVTVNEYDTAIMNCNTSIPDAQITWTKVVNNRRSQLGRNAQIIENNMLRIVNVRYEDRAVYVCRANYNGHTAMARGFLEVRKRGVAPVIDLSESSLTLMEGESAHSECRPSGGSPPPRVEWSRSRSGSLPRNIVQEGNLIRFNAVQLSDVGEYVCTASNSAGQVTAVLRLDVQTKPRIRVDPSGTVRRTAGERLQLICRATGVPAPAVHWEIETPGSVRSRPETTSETGQAIVDIYNLSQSDNGYYTCRATSSAGQAEESVYVQIIDNNVDQPPETSSRFEVDLYGATEITCSHPDRDPNVEFSWSRRDGRPLGRNVTTSGERLIFHRAEITDEGEYVCEGKDRNGYSTNSYIATLIVIERLDIRLTPEYQTVRPNDDAYIDCQVIGNRSADIRWEAVNRALPRSATQSGGRLMFKNIQVEDAGSYRCVAVDRMTLSSVTSMARVTVKHNSVEPAPSVRVIGDKNRTYTEGNKLFLQCVVSDTPNVDIIWTKEGSRLPTSADVRGGELMINNLYPEDSGVYICTARSQGSEASDSVHVRVEQGCSALGKISCNDGISCYDSSQICDGYNDCPDGKDEFMCSRRKRNHGALSERVFIMPSIDRIRVGETVDLRCVTEGIFVLDQPQWEKVGGGISDNVSIRDNVLLIHDVTTDNAGPYRCWIKKPNGQIVEDTYRLEVQADEPERSHPTVQRLAEKTKTVRVYESVEIECDTGLEPPVNFIWTRRNGQLLANQTSSRIVLNNVLPSDAGEYLCVASNSEVKIEFPTFLVVKGTIPRFTQQSLSFLKLKPMAGQSGYLKLDILMSIKPERPNGLILYNGEGKTPGKDFIAMGLRNSRVEFRFDVGSGEAVITSNNTVPMGKWSNITVKRERKEGRLWVNGIGPFIGTSPGRYQGLDLFEPMYLGSVPNYSAISPAAGFDTGFVGCISFLKINNRVEELSKALEKSDVSDCDTCSESSCRNNGVCQESPNERGFQCLCPRGFTGQDCQTTGATSACYPGICNEGRCVNTHTSYKCQCKLGTAGENCELKVTVNTPQFFGDSFLAYPIPAATSDFSLYLEAKFDNVRNSLLAYAGQNQNGHGDFASLTLRDHHIEFTVDTGSGPETIRNAHRVEPGTWLKISAEKKADELSLNVNGDIDDKILDARKTRAYKKGLNLLTPLYLGGYDDASISLHPSMYIKDGIIGCVKSLKINGRPPTHLIKNAVASSNVGQCPGVSFNDDLCGEQKCQNGGNCDYSEGIPVCACTSDYGGTYCEIKTNQCGKDPNPCGSQGVCQREKSNSEGYRCDCFFGFTGTTCQERTSITTEISFRRNSYVELPGHLTQQWRPDDPVSISMTIQTEEPIGLIFWQGTDGQYMSIGVKEGHIEAEVDHNDNPLTIRSRGKVDDARPHNVTVTRKASDLEITLDGITVASTNGQPPRKMPSRESIFIGGLADPWTMTNGRWKETFVGCILRLRINDGEALDFSKHHVSGRNVRSCLSHTDNNETK